MAEKPPINFLEAAKALREKRAAESQKPEEQVSQNAAPLKIAEIATPVFGGNVKKLPTPPPLASRPRESFIEPRPSMPGEYNMRMFSRLGSRFGDDMSLFGGLVGNSAEAQRKFSHLVKMDSALQTLRTQMSEARERSNVAMRRAFMREAGTEDLADQFWNSNEHDWSARPSTYIALLDELEERGFFNLSLGTDPEPEPPAPKVWDDEPNMNPDDDKPRSPGRPHRGRPKR